MAEEGNQIDNGENKDTQKADNADKNEELE